MQNTKTANSFATQVQGMQNSLIKRDAMSDLKNLAIMSLGVGAGSRGLLGLMRSLGGDTTPHSSANVPASLPLPVPVEEDEKVAFNMINTDAQATTKGGLSWYGPAMLMAGLGSAAAGWKGVDKVLDMRRKTERESELESARNEFQQALLSQYDKPVKLAAEAEPTLDSVFDKFAELLPLGPAAEAFTKEAFSPSETLAGWIGPDATGRLAGGYGMYAGLSALLAGTHMYDKAKKRSRRSIAENALEEREKRRFAEAPTEMYATPQPIPTNFFQAQQSAA